jgi:hypothetical protein
MGNNSEWMVKQFAANHKKKQWCVPKTIRKKSKDPETEKKRKQKRAAKMSDAVWDEVQYQRDVSLKESESQAVSQRAANTLANSKRLNRIAIKADRAAKKAKLFELTIKNKRLAKQAEIVSRKAVVAEELRKEEVRKKTPLRRSTRNK